MSNAGAVRVIDMESKVTYNNNNNNSTNNLKYVSFKGESFDEGRQGVDQRCRLSSQIG